MPRKTILGVCLLGAGLLTGCGTPGIPLPPSLNLPQLVSNLRATRKGDKVFLAWTPPSRTTDHQPIRSPIATRICRSVAAPLETCANAVGEVAGAKPNPVAGKNSPSASTVAATYTDILPASEAGTFAIATYSVEVMNDRGKSAGLSNRVDVSAAPTLAPPANFAAQVTAQGVVMSWSPPPAPPVTGSHHVLRIYRRQQNDKDDSKAAEVRVGEAPYAGPQDAQFVDHNFEWEKKYFYRAAVVTVIDRNPPSDSQVEGDDTPEASVFAHDIFPPSVPSGLEAASATANGQTFVDLIWTPDSEDDLAGYNVFRHENSDPPVKITLEPVKLPAFRDPYVSHGSKYYYSVSAIDIRGNESARSQEANETAP